MAAIAALVAGGGAAAQQAGPSFCARLAPQIGLSPTSKAGLYQGRLVSGLKAALVGGSGSIGFGVESVGTPTDDDARALKSACSMTRGEYRCVVDRPMVLTVSSNKGDGRVEAKPGEKALVTAKGVTVRCTDGVTA
ncbi:hypothetical protein [Sphingomonas yantingensis]|uniref:Uncharacterized protein n=1 Tax=Sphingomonas yantingensis TaxID=1241761 RepID=A0A7W9AMB1_9SPHN|nr:hypothetical protein [Sphingomonas yantingensis]MBB5696953.1 hypothetical protein [Sphingomonas yantingensis]